MSAPADTSAGAPAVDVADASLPLIRVGGVPEHFNLPWFLAQEQGLFSAAGVRVQWVEYKLGTGAMLTALQAGEVDCIVALTEGLVSAIATGSPLRLLGTYVESPLTWAISTGAQSAFNEVADLKGQTIGISRYTSGSHLMSCVLAMQRGWAQSDINFAVLGSFESLRKGVNSGEAAAFMWESFMTKPFHDSGEIRRIGEIVTPWPCFLLCSSQSVLGDAAKRDALHRMQSGVQEACRRFSTTPNMADEVATRYGLRPEDAAAWYAAVHITASGVVSESTLEQSLQALKDAGVLTKDNYPVDKYLSEFVDPDFVRIEADIKSMRLYHKPELLTALFNNIRVRLQKEKGPLQYTDLLPYDQNHYGGVAALDLCVAACGLGANSRVIQLGSSVGGPSRYLAGRLGCEVLAVELQEDLSGAARELTARCGLQGKVHHVSGNFLQVAKHLAPASYDCIASWLTILHFDRSERAELFGAALRCLKPGGVMFAEDFFERAPFDDAERRTLRHDVYVKYLPTLARYKEELTAAGFVVEAAEDLTQEWTAVTRQRVTTFDAERAQQVAVHGEQLVDGLRFFYDSVAKLFEGGHCGGVRLVCRKPLDK